MIAAIAGAAGTPTDSAPSTRISAIRTGESGGTSRNFRRTLGVSTLRRGAEGAAWRGSFRWNGFVVWLPAHPKRVVLSSPSWSSLV
jgi:hypothetical protein